jgi:hypothetical protein
LTCPPINRKNSIRQPALIISPIPASVRPMNAVETEAYSRLRESSKPELRCVKFTFERGILTLKGTVSDSQLRRIAQDLIANIEGILIIDNQLVVAPQTL